MRMKFLCETFYLSSVVYLKFDQEISAELYAYNMYSVACP